MNIYFCMLQAKKLFVTFMCLICFTLINWFALTLLHVCALVCAEGAYVPFLYFKLHNQTCFINIKMT